MGPEPLSYSSDSLLSRQILKWDISNVLWKDGKGSREEYAEKVKAWSAFHDLLSDTSSNKLDKELQGTNLKSQRNCRAKDLVKFFRKMLLARILDFCISSTRYVKSTRYNSCRTFMLTLILFTKPVSDTSKTCLILKPIFEAQIPRFTSHKAGKISDALFAVKLLSNFNIDYNHRV